MDHILGQMGPNCGCVTLYLNPEIQAQVPIKLVYPLKRRVVAA